MYQETPCRDSSKSLPAGVVGGDGLGRILRNADVVQQTGGARTRLSGLGMTAQEIADLIKSTSSSMLPLLIAQNPGTRMETRADGSIVVYNQPTGTQALLPGGFTSQGYTGPGASGSAQVGPVNLNAQGVDVTTIAMVAGVGLLAVLLMGRK